MNDKVVIERLATGVPGLDTLLGGGLAEFSFNIIAGTPGSGKTTLAHQLMFSLASSDRRAIFFTVLGEPALKMLRYQQQYSFFDNDKLDTAIRFVNLGDEVMRGDFEHVLQRIVEKMERFQPSFVFVDSFRSVSRAATNSGQGGSVLQDFVQRLSMHFTSWRATTFLIGEYMAVDSEANPIFTVADGIWLLMQNLHRSSMVRKIQISKSRGQATVAGLHTFRIFENGLQVFPRTLPAVGSTGPADAAARAKRPALGTGNAAPDEMLGAACRLGTRFWSQDRSAQVNL